MENRDVVQWEFDEKESLAENLEGLGQGINMLGKTLDSIGSAYDVAQQECYIHPYLFFLLSGVAQGMANSALRILDHHLRARKKGPSKLVPITRNDEAEGEEEENGKAT